MDLGLKCKVLVLKPGCFLENTAETSSISSMRLALPLERSFEGVLSASSIMQDKAAGVCGTSTLRPQCIEAALVPMRWVSKVNYSILICCPGREDAQSERLV